MNPTNLKSWLPFDESATADKCGNSWTITGNAALSTAIKKFGAASIHLPKGAYLTANGIINLNADKWTFDCWVYLVSSSGDEGYFALSAKTNANRYGIINSNDGIWIAATRSGWQAKNENLLFPSIKNQWVHLAIVKNGSTVTFYQDGVSVWSFTTSALDNSGAFILGGNYYGYNTDIYFDEVRFVEGEALWTDNFTPPTAEDYLEMDSTIARYLSFTGNAGCYGELPLEVLAGATTFTIEAKFSTTATASSSKNYQWKTLVGREIGNYWQDDFGLCVNGGKLCFWAEPKSHSDATYSSWTTNAVVNDGEIHKVAVTCSNGNTFDIYCDGANVAHFTSLRAKITENYKIGIAYNLGDSNSYLQMDLYEARFWSIARTAEEIFADIDGTEQGLEAWYIPSEDGLRDYSANNRHATLYGSPAYTFIETLPLTLDFDVERKIKNAAKLWRYFISGDEDDFIENPVILDKSNWGLVGLPTMTRTGGAIYQTQRAKCFDIPATDEIWLKFDVYFDGTNRWRAYNGGSGGDTGVCVESGNFCYFINQGNSLHQQFSNVQKVNTLQTVLLHMVSGSTAGVIEAWVDGTFIYRYTGDVNHGQDFADIYLQSDGADTVFSNIVISNGELTFDEGCYAISFDTVCRFSRRVILDFDVARNIQSTIAIDFAADVVIRDVLPIDFSADITRNIIKAFQFDFDVELRDFVPVDLFLDVSRNIRADVNLYPVDAGQFIGENTRGITDIEISIETQQLTDAVKISGVMPFYILEHIFGQYFDYLFNMRVEKVQRQGILYTADCCTDLDELLYTPLNYDLPATLSVTVTSSESSKASVITIHTYPLASQLVEKIADALGLEPVIRINDFYSTVIFNSEKENGATYADLIRDIFGWSSRVPTQVINCYIRAGKLFVIQRGCEANTIDISNTDHTLPVYNFELIRLFWQRQKYSTTRTRSYTYTKSTPKDQSYDGDSSYEYDDDLLKKTETTSTNSDGEEVRTVTEYKYKDIWQGGNKPYKKVLYKEITKKYVGGELEETTETKHTPLNQGLSHQARFDEDGDIIGEGVGQHSGDNRVTPYQQFKEDEDDEETKNITTTIEGLTLFDTSFPIPQRFDVDMSGFTGTLTREAAELLENIQNSCDPEKAIGRLKQITDDIKNLNRKTLETVTTTVYDFPHLIDFNDKIILDGAEYFLVRNRAKSTSRIRNEQALTLVRWY